MGKCKKGKDKPSGRTKTEQTQQKKRQIREKNTAKFGASEERQYQEQMAALGCHIKKMSADGNCLFRSLADQLAGRPTQHSHYRDTIMSHIETHRDEFEPFMEDDEPFDAYVSRMRTEREWGGHQELFAASQLFKVQVVVHQLRAPRLEMHCEGAVQTLHLSYHGEAHYNSVRTLDDPDVEGQPPKAIPGLLQQNGSTEKGPTKEEGEEKGKGKGRVKGVREVLRSVPAAKEEDVVRALSTTKGDVSAAIELLLEESANASAGDASNDDPQPPPVAETDEGEAGGEEGKGDGDEGKVGKGAGKRAAGEGKRDKKLLQPVGHCPCGSGKKYRKCCKRAERTKEGATAGLPPPPAANDATGLEAKLQAIVI